MRLFLIVSFCILASCKPVMNGAASATKEGEFYGDEQASAQPGSTKCFPGSKDFRACCEEKGGFLHGMDQGEANTVFVCRCGNYGGAEIDPMTQVCAAGAAPSQAGKATCQTNDRDCCTAKNGRWTPITYDNFACMCGANVMDPTTNQCGASASAAPASCRLLVSFSNSRGQSYSLEYNATNLNVGPDGRCLMDGFTLSACQQWLAAQTPQYSFYQFYGSGIVFKGCQPVGP